MFGVTEPHRDSTQSPLSISPASSYPATPVVLHVDGHQVTALTVDDQCVAQYAIDRGRSHGEHEVSLDSMMITVNGRFHRT
jgi:hypothetical protein